MNDVEPSDRPWPPSGTAIRGLQVSLRDPRSSVTPPSAEWKPRLAVIRFFLADGAARSCCSDKVTSRKRQRRQSSPDCFRSAIALSYAGCPFILAIRGEGPREDKASRRHSVRCDQVTLGSQPELDRLAGRIDGAIQVSPNCRQDLRVRIVDAPGPMLLCGPSKQRCQASHAR
jgi:hypothetical protein